MEEGSYRQSRLCRLLGNPVAFAVVQLLVENGQMSPSEIARAVGRSVQRASIVEVWKSTTIEIRNYTALLLYFLPLLDYKDRVMQRH